MLQRIHELLRLTVQADLARQRARFACGPQLFDVARVVVRPIADRGPKLFLPPATRAVHRNRPLPSPESPVPPKHHHFVSGEEIGETARLHVIQLDTRSCGNRHIGEDRTGHLGGQGTHGPLDVLSRADVFGRAARTLGETVEKIGIHIVADAEREDTELAAALLGTGGDPLGIRLAGAGLAVGQEHDHTQRLLGGRLGERLGEGTGDVRPALRVEAANPRFGIAARVRCHFGPSLCIATHAAGERDQPESIAFAQGAEQLNQGGLGLLDLFSRHRTRDVDDRDDIAAQCRGIRGCARRKQQHEVAVLTHGMMRYERQANQPARERQ